HRHNPRRPAQRTGSPHVQHQPELHARPLPQRRRSGDARRRRAARRRRLLLDAAHDQDRDLMLPLAALAVFVALALVGYAVFEQLQERATIRNSLRQLGGYEVENARDQELLNPLRQRAIAPATEWLTGLGRRLTPVGFVEPHRRKLVVAGKPARDDLDRFLAIRVLSIALIPVWAILFF